MELDILASETNLLHYDLLHSMDSKEEAGGYLTIVGKI